MALAESLLPEFDREMATTRRLLARVPEARLDWQPHPKSMALGRLAEHLGDLAMWGAATLTQSGMDLEKMTRPPEHRPPATVAALLAGFDANVMSARTALVGRTDAELAAPWTLRQGSQEFFTLPKAGCWRTFVMSHLVHHRGQLSVYLRLLDVPVPSIYGPSADEQTF